MVVSVRDLAAVACALLAAVFVAQAAGADVAAGPPVSTRPHPAGESAGDGEAPAAADPAPPEAIAADPEPAEEWDPLFDEDLAQAEAGVYDPLEPANRVVYAFNRQVGEYFWDPLASSYRFVVPAPARRAVRRVFDNLNAPIYATNHLLQLDPLSAVETLGAFAMNATFGIGGLFDTASGVGWELQHADFGQTLALYGVGSGPYLMLPVLGPTTVRDGFGFIIDRGFHPATYFFGFPVQLITYGGVGFARMEESIDQLNALEESALDPYAVLRSAYMQDRRRSIEALREDHGFESYPPPSAPGASLASGDRSL